jgi:hypothetical protein
MRHLYLFAEFRFRAFGAKQTRTAVAKVHGLSGVLAVRLQLQPITARVQRTGSKTLRRASADSCDAAVDINVCRHHSSECFETRHVCHCFVSRAADTCSPVGVRGTRWKELVTWDRTQDQERQQGVCAVRPTVFFHAFAHIPNVF